MVSKCANPECSATFLYFHVGKLFRIETDSGQERRRAMGADSEQKRRMRHIEFYWLCDMCSDKMKLVFEKGVGIVVQPVGACDDSSEEIAARATAA